MFFFGHLQAELGKEEDGARLLRFRVDFDSLLILEKKKISSHLADLPYLDKPAPVKTLLKALEDHGEASVRKKINFKLT